MLGRIALRNIARNRRRSTMTVVAVAVGAVSMLTFGAFMAALVLGFKSSTIAAGGHLSIFERGYLDYGSGDPGRYSIGDYGGVIARIEADPELAPRIRVITPHIALTGIAGNFAADRSRTFLASAFVPSDREKLARWDEYGVRKGHHVDSLGMSDGNDTQGVVGTGLARILGFCDTLRLGNCPPIPTSVGEPALAGRPAPDIDIAALSAREDGSPVALGIPSRPRIDLLAATTSGAPNVVSMNIGMTSEQSLKDYDDAYVGLPLSLAQTLLYGRGEKKATSIVIQLWHTADMKGVETHLQSLFAKSRPDLEFRNFVQLTPMYTQIVALFGSILGFIALIMSVIVLFTVTNSMSMSVVERTQEIGTVRALGVQRGSVRAQFLLEGSLLGFIGATAGVLLAIGVSVLVNRSGLTWTPPGQTGGVPLRLLISNIPQLIVFTWAGLVGMSAMAALFPANGAARMTVVDALRHV